MFSRPAAWFLCSAGRIFSVLKEGEHCRYCEYWAKNIFWFFSLIWNMCLFCTFWRKNYRNRSKITEIAARLKTKSSSRRYILTQKKNKTNQVFINNSPPPPHSPLPLLCWPLQIKVNSQHQLKSHKSRVLNCKGN